MERNRSLRMLGAALLAVSIVILLVASAAEVAGESKTLYAFKQWTTGNRPEAGLIFDQSGNLYGTDAGGGDRGRGTVFELKSNPDGSWTESTLYNFCSVIGCADGRNPTAGLIFDATGNLYGTTVYGGAQGGGVAFKLAANSDGSWAETVLYNFNANGNPRAGLIFDQSGNLYGTTTAGGNGQGSVFELSPHSDGSWTYSTLYSFCSLRNCSDGSTPVAGLIFDATGNLYGTTSIGGVNCPTGEGAGCGVVFKLTPNTDGSWKETVLHQFNGNNGSNPAAGLIFGHSGNLYGTTDRGGNLSDCQDFGCGVVFQLTPNSDGSWKESVLHKFTGGNGSYPVASLIFDQTGNLYGTTLYGGNLNCANGCGVVFKLTPNSKGGWYETVLQAFSDRPSAYPQAGLIFDSAGNLYGTTGGYGKTYGSVFEITP